MTETTKVETMTQPTTVKPNNGQNQGNKPKQPSVFMNFLGSMNLAVTLLVMLSIASVIGTVLQQNQTAQDYIIKFGPFWSEVYSALGLFHVYGAAWFVLVLVFLLISTSVCVTRNTPTFLKDMKQFSEKLSKNAIKHQPNNAVIESPLTLEQQQGYAKALLDHNGYKTKVHQRDDGSVTVAGLKGRWNRLGYFFTHISIIVICVGALLDSNLLLKFRELTGDLKAETRSVSLDEINQESWLGPDNLSFRGSVNIPEGDKTDVLFLPYENGYLVQKLPFTIVNEAFHIEYYDTGMPKNYQSELVLTSPDLEEPIRQTIEVNKPLYYKNYAIYQSSFGDGGTKLKLKVHPLLSPIENSIKIDTQINGIEPLKTPVGTFKAEFNDFRMHNIVPATEEEIKLTGRKMHNNGPTIIFKVRNEQGKAWEYENYMLPSKQEDRLFFMTGVRTMSSEPFRYLFIPADANRKKDRFFKFLAKLNNPLTTKELFTKLYPKTEDMSQKTYDTQTKLLQQLLMLFRSKGFAGINGFVEKNVPDEDREKVSEYYFGQTSFALQTLYMDVLVEEGVVKTHEDEISDFDKTWFEDALNTISGLSAYGPPMYFEMESFTQIEATGLQITKSPGKDIVYFGSAMLIIGVFFLFYLRQRRTWIHIQPKQKEEEGSEGVEVTIASKDNKNLPETTAEFELLVSKMQDYNEKSQKQDSDK
ncbi:cytochrome c biogenesis protein ResB [Thiomicrorhabdus lithotrophica]|uniref:Cytochrome c biogenesis protein ResB n=1 Tax=Thiomicrorhabdus lithotrophica TaxID=2949997 RepID=A0ABY8CBV5_9GAMM|nr:cytochrome c biogenesis protein ResB [Thiomicrorhabdus lithotrophica]WEJ62687.1 cytochrome c biogenesis protein ResB [Thiomicrorhabdus lithotrophica]